MDGEGAPLYRWCVEVAVLDVKIPGAHCLWPETVEQGHFGTASDAHCKEITSLLSALLRNHLYYYSVKRITSWLTAL